MTHQFLKPPGKVRRLLSGCEHSFIFKTQRNAGLPGASIFKVKRRANSLVALWSRVSRSRSSLNFPVKSPYGSPRSVKLLIPPTCLAGEARCEAPRLS